MTKAYYITFRDYYNGVYKGQVIDTIKLYQRNNIEMKLICFTTIKGYFFNRKQIKSQISNSIVLPTIPRLKNWKIHSKILNWIIKSNKVYIGRGVFATNLILESGIKGKVIYDGRGAITEEQNEYNLYENTGLENQIIDLEKNAILKSDFRIAVTEKLVQYWKSKFNYKSDNHTIIPCTISDTFLQKENQIRINEIKNELNINSNDCVIIHVGSVAGWQSFDDLRPIVKGYLKQPNIKFIFLSPKNNSLDDFISQNPSRITRKEVSPEEVVHYLDCANYGLLFRGASITNSVASPVKTAEYLSRNLKVLISKNIGDYSDLIVKENYGYFIEDISILNKGKNSSSKDFVLANLSKHSKTIVKKYLSLL